MENIYVTSINSAFKRISDVQNNCKVSLDTLETAWEMLKLEFLKLHQFLGPFAACFGHLIVISLQVLTDCMRSIEGDFYIQTVVTTFLTAAYLYSWTLGNPHLAVPQKNTPFYEVTLMLASGHYASSIFSSTCCYETAYSVIGLMVMSGSLSDDRGANVIATYIFLVEVASFFFQLRDYAVRCRHPCKMLTDILYPIVIVVARIIGLWHLTMMILFQELIPFIHKLELLLLTSISTYFASETLCRMGGCQRPLPRSGNLRRRRSRLSSVRRRRSTSSIGRTNRRYSSGIYRSSSRTSFTCLTSSSRIRS